MNVLSSSTTINASLEAAWLKLLNWQEWTKWDGGMEAIHFDGPIEAGSSGRLKLAGGPTVDLVIIELMFQRSYKSEFRLLGTRYVFDHIVAPNGNQVDVRVDVETHGATSFVFGNILKAKLRTALPDWVDSFKKQLEQD